MDVNGIYKRLRDVREDMDLTQEKMALMMKVSKSTYCKWEKETDVIPLKRVNNLANVTNLSLDYIAGLSMNRVKSNELFELNQKEIGSRLREVRLENGLVEREVADILGTTQSTVSSYELGNTLVLSAFACKIARTYHVSLDWIVGRSNIKEIEDEVDLELLQKSN